MSAAVAEVKEATIQKCIEKKIERLEKPYQDIDVLCHFYHDEGMSTRDLGDKFGCDASTISNWLDKTGLDARTEDWKVRLERASFTAADSGGHEHWKADDPDGTTRTVHVHRLLAVADGADPHDVFGEESTHVHHKSGIPWLNIEDGVEVLTVEEHNAVHLEDEWTEEDGIPMMETN
ncbi:hypothetical protein [Haloarcula sp. H-GB5]